MTPIINPWFFYWFDVVDALMGTAGFILFFDIIIIIFSTLYWVFEPIYFDEISKKLKRFIKALIISIIFSLLSLIFIPTSSTLTKMLIAQNVTYERVEMATDTVQTVYEDIMTLFEEGEK